MILPEHDRVLHDYLRAKDEQRPYLFRRVFTEDARFVSRSAFAADFSTDEPAVGLAAITDVFRRLGRMCENIFTIYAVDSVHVEEGVLSNLWIVGMQEREGGIVRVAWGDYRWTFSSDGTRATELLVLMEGMALPEPAQTPEIMEWLCRLSAPWSTSAEIVGSAPALPELDPLRAYFSGSTDPR